MFYYNLPVSGFGKYTSSEKLKLTFKSVDPPILFEIHCGELRNKSSRNSPAASTSSAEFIIAAAHVPPSPKSVKHYTYEKRLLITYNMALSSSDNLKSEKHMSWYYNGIVNSFADVFILNNQRINNRSMS